jgi:hypothetical protein
MLVQAADVRDGNHAATCQLTRWAEYRGGWGAFQGCMAVRQDGPSVKQIYGLRCLGSRRKIPNGFWTDVICDSHDRILW